MSANVWPNRLGRPATTPGTIWPLRGRWDGGEPPAPPAPAGEATLIYSIQPHKVYDEWAARTGVVPPRVEQERAWAPSLSMQGTGTASTFMRLSKSIVMNAAGAGSGVLEVTTV